MEKQIWPTTERNKQPILDVLRLELCSPARVLEIASGTGQHAAYFAEHLPHLEWQPSDIDPAQRASIEAWRAESGLRNMMPSIELDVLSDPWPTEDVDAVFNANMIHISPWECAEALARGAGQVLRPEGKLILYGPFRLGGHHTAESNAAFDVSLRQRNPAWGVRDLDAFAEVARRHGLAPARTIPMPANNQMAVFRRLA